MGGKLGRAELRKPSRQPSVAAMVARQDRSACFVALLSLVCSSLMLIPPQKPAHQRGAGAVPPFKDPHLGTTASPTVLGCLATQMQGARTRPFPGSCAPVAHWRFSCQGTGRNTCCWAAGALPDPLFDDCNPSWENMSQLCILLFDRDFGNFLGSVGHWRFLPQESSAVTSLPHECLFCLLGVPSSLYMVNRGSGTVCVTVSSPVFLLSSISQRS